MLNWYANLMCLTDVLNWCVELMCLTDVMWNFYQIVCEEGGQVLTKLRTSHARCTKWGYSNTLIYLFWFRRQLQIVKIFGLHLNINTKSWSHWLHLFHFSPLCVFRCVLKLLAWEDAKSHRLHLFGFSLLCVLKCVLKLLA